MIILKVVSIHCQAGQTSANGKWLDNFNVFGSDGVQDDGTATKNVFFEAPAVSTSTSQTHSTLVTSTQKWGNLELNIDVKEFISQDKIVLLIPGKLHEFFQTNRYIRLLRLSGETKWY